MPHLAAIDERIADAIERAIFPGAVVLAAGAGKVRHLAAYGSSMYADTGSRSITPDTIYDIASLTKMFTATAVLQLLAERALRLHDPLSAYLPALRWPNVTIWHALTHTSGLDIRLSGLRERGPDGLMAAVYDAPQIRPPGSAVAYTNVNSLLLGALIEQVRGQSLDLVIRQHITGPLGMDDTGFRPGADLVRIAPTEHDDDWRGGIVHGSVHDESAHALGGVAGHAGMFSTAADLARFCQMWLDAVREGHPLLEHDWAVRATTNQTAPLGVACGLGWMMDRANFMGAAPAGTCGHTGFTGPAIIISPQTEALLVFLCNRTYPRRTPPPYRHHPIIAGALAALLQRTT